MTGGVEVYIGLGSNLSDGNKKVAEAIDYLLRLLYDSAASDIYQTASCSADGTMYFNAVVRGTALISVAELNDLCKQWEASHGRTAEARVAGIVTIDLDVVIADGQVLRPVDASREYFLRGYRQLMRL